ncbi:ATPase [Limosilactobacillus equigenerosi DSM 18793 = JCM 14505]|uniref:Replication-associated recombination protein A n=2 Tax=Limosilactobacillus TaxID=2742598 RepID=A0A0R1UUK1_9LACO|nr:ATPase [Limosilactobacillus equigenerosi DSM 18793 = JCM 14505]
MRPRDLSEIVGQQHLVAPGKIIWRMVEAKMLSSMILYGPPGTGKTSIASAIAGSTKYAFRTLNAATDSKKELQVVAEEAKMSGTVILLLDEIHRLDKAKQDFLLPHLESGRIILVGATTENPYLSINPAIRSRTQIFEVHPLTNDEISLAIDRALTDQERGLGSLPLQLDDDARQRLITAANGDLRSTLNGLELAAKSTPKNEAGIIKLTLDVIANSIQRPSLSFDKNGDNHYNIISALQKSIRGSDTDAALHYLARLVVGGDLPIIARRLLVIAYEDIGLANPPVAQRVVAAIQTAQQIGFPEARIPLANAVIEMCLSPKSNSAIMAIDAAINRVNKGNLGDIPNHLKDAHYQGAAKLGHGVDYLYPHNYPEDWVKQQYLPDNLKNDQYYEPKTNGQFEQAYRDQYYRLLNAQRKS